MIDLNKAIHSFKNYVSHYDRNNSSIHLKIVHTYEVMKITEELCQWLSLNEEDTQLAILIGLLHDIGRFEQYRIYHSFEDYKTTDHALFSSQLLFRDGLIREFIEADEYDDIIRISIEQHNKYKIDSHIDERTLLFVHLIRDADKLDNFRVKETETIETLFHISLEELEKEEITNTIYEQFKNNKLIYAPDRKTHLDMWLSYIAFIYDLYFQESYIYIHQNDWINRSFQRIRPIGKTTNKQYNELREIMIKYVREVLERGKV